MTMNLFIYVIIVTASRRIIQESILCHAFPLVPPLLHHIVYGPE